MFVPKDVKLRNWVKQRVEWLSFCLSFLKVGASNFVAGFIYKSFAAQGDGHQ